MAQGCFLFRLSAYLLIGCWEWELASKGLEGNEGIEWDWDLVARDYEGYERKDEGVLRFSGHPDDLIWFLEDVRDLCMQAGCFEDHKWAQWCPTVCYSKHDLYDLVDKQKKVKIDSCKALLNYWLCFTDIAAQLQISNQLSWIKKDDLFLKGLKWNNQREYADNPWPTCQVTREAERLLKEGYCFELREDSLKLLKAPGEGSRGQAVKVEGIEVTLYIAEESLTAELQGECLRGNLEEQSEEKLLGVKASAELELRANERPINAEACATDVLKPTPEPRGDLCEVQEQVGCTEVEEIKPRVEVERPSKVVAWRKPPEGWTWSLRVETCMTSPSALSQPAKRSGATTLCVNDAHSLAPRTCSAAAVEIDASLSQKSENCLFKGYEVYKGKVEAPHSGGWSSILESTVISSTRKSTKEAALRVRTPKMLCKKKWMPPCVEGEARWLQEGPHSCDGHVHTLYGVLDQVFKAMRLGIELKQSPGPHWHSGQGPSFTLQVFMFFLECTKVFEESDEHETPSRLICLLWRVLSVFLEDTLWSGEPLLRPLLRSGNPALSHWTLTLVRGLVFSCDYLQETRMLRESEEVAKRSPSVYTDDIQSLKNPSKVKR
ncbi:hypothetical protein EDD16DRAFT_1520091 [Pisolithus croceorrhizus]|nr:hypothetical protein EDD16DRAFT_1520091 [Pisolithus croceorrhizus]